MTDIKQLLASTRAKADKVRELFNSLNKDLYDYLEEESGSIKSIILKKTIPYHVFFYGQPSQHTEDRWIASFKMIQRHSDPEPTWYAVIVWRNSILYHEEDTSLIQLCSANKGYTKSASIPRIIELIEKNKETKRAI